MDDDFNSLLSRDFGFKPQGKSAPMAAPRTSGGNSFASSVNFGLGSGPIFDDHNGNGKGTGGYGSSSGRSENSLFNDVFGGPPKQNHHQQQQRSLSSDYDSVFKTTSSSLPVFDKPVYDDDDHDHGNIDIFDGLPGLRSASVGPQSSANDNSFNNVFASIGTSSSSPPNHRPVNKNSNDKNNSRSSPSPLDDLLVNLGKKEKESSKRETGTDSAAFDDLLSGFGRSSSPSISRSTSESNRPHKPSTNSARTTSSMMDDPFADLGTTSGPTASSSGLYADPLEEISKFSSTGSTKADNSSSINRGSYDDADSFDDLGKSIPPLSSGINKRGKDKSPLRTGPTTGGAFSGASKESVDNVHADEAEYPSQKKMANDNFRESQETYFDMPPTTDFHRSMGQNVTSSSYVNASPKEGNSPPRYEDISEANDDIWLTVSEIPLFTQPTSAPPPSRPPPPRPPRISKSEMGSFSSTSSKKKANEYSFSNSTSYSQSPRSARAGKSSTPSQIDELEDFAMGRTPGNANEHAEVPYGEDMDANASSAAASAAAMKDAMDKAEAKFRQMREREYIKAARSREVDKDMQEVQQRELRERQERLDRERLQRDSEEEDREQRKLEKEREREEKEREQRRLERERERAREIEREREKARQAVERATREARERAAAEARLKAERAAVGKASAEARERAERAAVQRVQAEARERSAAEAKERAERAAAEARERANAESREKEARERAAVERAAADARQRAERAAVERAAGEARERAAAAARANQQRNDSQQKNETDFDSFFTSRASSAPRPRNNSDPLFDTQSKGGSEAAKRTSVGPTSNNIKKASSTTNIVDDLSSIFGGTAGTNEDFREIGGETEERRRARLERHQRTQERAAKALAEKNQRDHQVQMEQAERHRISETLDAEIRRWAAGKEGNLRALLSTMQYVLWPECGWQPVSLTDLITGASVKKFYRKATLCIHPDKVQQKGANLQQKYIAEKVFDLLKEAWNKFNSEELF
ncbi:auxilin-related protein 1 [Mercurialis annua]|uniref:auxilin-related protein 1 n=1 Tax=Mercurialis annua TaxID=3986 RepID=UPI00215F540E|nr:auxilin-related protein 1 [Mercurialis annua]